MNLTKMRAFGWTDYVGFVYQKYRLKIKYGDQDIINIIFHNEPHRLLVYGCEHNLRPDHCTYGRSLSTCKTAEEKGKKSTLNLLNTTKIYVIVGAAIIHGNRGYFHLPDKQPAFSAIYDVFEQCQISNEMDLKNDLLAPLESSLEAVSDTTCGRIRHSFIDPIKRRVNEISKVSDADFK